MNSLGISFSSMSSYTASMLRSADKIFGLSRWRSDRRMNEVACAGDCSA